MSKVVFRGRTRANLIVLGSLAGLGMATEPALAQAGAGGNQSTTLEELSVAGDGGGSGLPGGGLGGAAAPGSRGFGPSNVPVSEPQEIGRAHV